QVGGHLLGFLEVLGVNGTLEVVQCVLVHGQEQAGAAGQEQCKQQGWQEPHDSRASLGGDGGLSCSMNCWMRCSMRVSNWACMPSTRAVETALALPRTRISSEALKRKREAMSELPSSCNG